MRQYEKYRAIASQKSGDAYTFISSDGNETTYTWSTLFETVESLQLPTKSNRSLVAILCAKQETQTLHMLAALHAGAVPAILTPPNRKLEPHYYAQQLIGVLDGVAPNMLITDLDQSILSILDDRRRTYDTYNTEGKQLQERNDVFDHALPDRTVFVQFSSGTTGIKKGVAISETALSAQLHSYSNALAISSDDCIVSWLPLYHDMGYFTSLHLALANGVRTVMLDPLHWVGSPIDYLKAVDRFGATLGWHPNFAYNFMAQRYKPESNQHINLGSLRHLVNCSEPTTDQSQRAFVEHFKPFGLRPGVMTGCYAMAETTFAVTHQSATDVEHKDAIGPDNAGTLHSRLPLVSVGKPIGDVEIDIRNNSGGVLPDRQIGKLWVRAPFLADGYINNPDATAAAFVDGWYDTGDLGYSMNGQYYVTGRSKDLLIIAGHNVFPEDVEASIGSTKGIKPGRVVVFAEFDERIQTERAVALAEPDDSNTEVNIVSLRQKLLAEFSIAVAVNIVEPGWLVKSSSGKMSRKASADKWASTRS